MLKPDKTRVENSVTINEKIIPDSARANKYCASWCKAGEPMKPCRPLSYGVTGVTIHNTEDLPKVKDDGEQYTRATWPNCNMGGVVVHYYVDDLCAWQNLKESEAGWHATDGTGQGNYGTIAIEVIMDAKSEKRNAAAEANAAKLAASILHRYGLGIDQLYTHNHWLGLADRIVPGARKNCPLYILPHWDRFKAAVKAELEGLSGKADTDTFGGDTFGGIAAGSVGSYMVRITTKDLNIRKGPGTNYNIVGVIQPGAYTLVAESVGQGATMWGKLKSGVGWVSLDFCRKV